MIAAVAEAAIEALPPGAIKVTVWGESELATAILTLLGDRASSEEAPDAIVETTGEPAGIEAALHRVDDLGTVVLAGPSPPGPVALDLYRDLHVRGLSLVGLDPLGGLER